VKKKTAPTASKPHRNRERLLLLGVAVLIGLAWATLRTRSHPPITDPPQITTTAFEPVIANLIEQALTEVKASPRSGPAWGKLGMILMVYDLASEARDCFSQAERLAPREPRWPYLQGLLLLPDEAALPKLARAVELAKGEPLITRIRLAHALAEHGRQEQAGEQFRRLPPNHPAALLGLANLKVNSGDAPNATIDLGKALTDPHTARAAHLLLASIQQRHGDPDAARSSREVAAALPPDRDWPDSFLAETDTYRHGRKLLGERIQQFLQSPQPAQAAPLINRLIEEYPQAPEGWLHLGQMRLSQENCAAAEQAFRKHLSLRPDSVNGQSLLGTALLCQERYPEAADAFARAIELKPDFGQAHFNLGFARARAGQAVEAIESFRQAIRYNPDFIDPYIVLADLLGQLGETTEALNLLETARRLAPSDPRIQALTERIPATRQ